MKRIVLFVLLLSALLFPPALAQDAVNQPPEIVVTVNGTEIPYIIGLNVWDGAIYDREDTFQSLMKGDPDLLSFSVGAEMTICFPEAESFPEVAALYDYVLYFNEDELYNPQAGFPDESIEFTPSESGMSATIVIEEHILRLASSRFEDFSPGASIRGFRLECEWADGNSCEYAFVIRV